MSSASGRETRAKPVWLPPLASVAVLFSLFLLAMAVRRAGFDDTGRTIMITLSGLAGAGITLYGGKMLADARQRGWPSAIA